MDIATKSGCGLAPKNDSLRRIVDKVSCGLRASYPFGQCLSQALLLRLPVELQTSVRVSVKLAADAELMPWEAPGHNGLSITATPA